MLITTKLNIDMQRNVQRHVVNVVQNDTNTRAAEFRLFSDCGRWIVPDGVTAALSYSKPDGTSGIYDKLPDGANAFTITGEAVTVILAPQMLTVPGEVRAALVLTESNSDQLSTFPFVVNVAESPNPGKIVSENYCYYTNLDAINAAINELKQAVAGNGGGTGGGSGSDSGQNIIETVSVPVNINDEVYTNAHFGTSGDQIWDIGLSYGLMSAHYLPVIGGKTIEALYGNNSFTANVRIVQYNENKEVIVAPVELRHKIANGTQTSDTSVPKQLVLNEETAFIRFSVTHWDTNVVMEDVEITIAYVEDGVTDYINGSVTKEQTFVRRTAILEYEFATLEDMKSCNTLKAGDHCKTSGYYSYGDGGGANYVVVSEVDTTAHQEIISAGLYATMLHDGYVNVKQFGAISYASMWSATSDSSDAFQKAFDIATVGVCIPEGGYKIDKTVTISNKTNFVVDAEKALIRFDGTSGCCFMGTGIAECVFKFNSITAMATVAGCLEFYSADKSTHVQYIDVYFKHFYSDANCVYVHADGGWVCELRFFNGQVSCYTSNDKGTGFKFDSSNNLATTDHYTFRNVGIEGIHTGFHFLARTEGLDSSSTDSITGILQCINIVDCRSLENFTTLLKTEGWVRYIKIDTSCLLYERHFDLGLETYDSEIRGTICETGGMMSATRAMIYNGVIIPQDFPRMNTYCNALVSDLSLNDNMLQAGTVYVTGEVEKIKLTKAHGRLYGVNTFVLKVLAKNANGLAVYDSEDNLICDGSNINADDIVEFKWLPGLDSLNIPDSWIATKIGTMPLITSE